MSSQYTTNNILGSLSWARWLPVLVGICVFVLTVLLWQNLKEKERAHLESSIELKTQEARSEVVSQLVPQIQGLIRMARRFGDHGDMTKLEWEKDADLYIEHFPSYRAIGWADSAGRLQWVVPLRGNGELQGLDLFSNVPGTAKMTRQTAEVAISPAINLAQGEKVIFVCVPIFDGAHDFKGHIVGVFPIIKLWDAILKGDAFHGISVSLYEGKQEIYRQANHIYAVESMVKEEFVGFYGTSWRLQVRPLQQWVEKQDTSMSYGVLCFGTMMAFLLFLSLHFAGVSRYHAAFAESANKELARQIEVRKQTELALRESKELYSDIVSLIPDIVYRLDTQGRFTYISPAGAYFGFDPEKLVGKCFYEIVHPNDFGLAKYHFDEKRRGERATRLVEFRILSPTGVTRDCEMKETTIHLSATGYYVEKEKPAFAGTQGIIRDITEQKMAREELLKANEDLELRVRERTQSLLDLNRNLQEEVSERQSISMVLQGSEARLRAIMDNSPVVIYLKDLQGNYCQVNRKFESLLNISEEGMLGKNDNDLFPMGTAAKLVSNDEMVVHSKTSQEFEETIALPAGMRTFFTIRYPLYDTLGNIYAIGGISLDVTERKRAEAIDLRLKRIVDNSFNEIYIFEAETLRFIHVSRGARENLGYSMDELSNMTPLDLKPDYDMDKFAFLIQPLRSGEKTLIVFETVLKRKDGTSYPVEVRLQLSVTERPQVYLAIIQDITERKMAEEALHKSHLELANAQRIAHLGNWAWNIVSNDLHWSDETYRIFGLAPQSFGANYEAFLERVHPLDRDYVKNSVNESLSEKKPYRIDHRIILQDGSIRTVHEQAEVIVDDEGRIILMRGTVQDITEDHRIKSELEQSHEQLRDLCAHLELVREEERTRIAREVHDELGQMLTALKIDLAWTKSQLTPCEEPVAGKIESMRSLLDSTILAVQRITAELRPQILDILGLVATIEWETSEFQKRTGVKCWLNVEKNIIVDKQQSTTIFRIIQEALTNVARHASAGNVHVILKDRADHLLLEVRDDGKGLEQEHIADPKSFGLIGIRERALLHKGEVAFRGSPGMGTTIAIKFPKGE